ncbi:MAG: hypothetical protein QNJ54_26630 [Prochloraceae cyanobacterium]|nr:hypothetical protein [Prochloraceae cyanobacterium]
MMANFFTQLVQRFQETIPVAQPLIAPRFSPNMAIAGDFLEFSTFEPSSLGQTKIDFDRKPDTLSPEKESTINPDIVELMPSLPPGHWSANRSRLHQIQTLEPFEPFEFNNIEEDSRQEAEDRKELVEKTSLSASLAPENPSTRAPRTDNLSSTSLQPTSADSPETELPSQTLEKGRRELLENNSLSASLASENPSTRSPRTDNLSPTSQQPTPTHPPETELPSQAHNSPCKQQVDADRNISPPQLMPQVENSSLSASLASENPSTRAPRTDNLSPTSLQPTSAHSPETELSSQAVTEGRRELGENSSLSASLTSENPSTRAPRTDNLSPTSQQPITPTHSPETELPSQTLEKGRRELLENNSLSASLASENPSTRAPVTDNFPPVSPSTKLPFLADNFLSQQQVDAGISPPQLMPQVEKSSLPASLAPENHSTRALVTDNLPPSSQQAAPAVSPSTKLPFLADNFLSQKQVDAGISPPQLMPQVEKSSFPASLAPENHSTRALVTDNLPPASQQAAPAVSPSQSSGFDIDYSREVKNISPQQQLSSASGSTKIAQVKPLADLANAQNSQSSTGQDSTEVPPKKIEINIRRIIVRVAEEPPTPPKSSTRSKHKKPALSLSDYLKQRRKEYQ